MHLMRTLCAVFITMPPTFTYKKRRANSFSDNLEVAIATGYHLHRAGRHSESYEHNSALAEFAQNIGNLDLAERCYRRALKDAEKLNLSDHKIVSMVNLSHNVLIIWGRLDEALKNYETILAANKDENNLLRIVYYDLSQIYYIRGNYGRALDLLNKSLTIVRSIGDIKGTSRVLEALSNVYYTKGDYGRALDLLNENLSIARSIGDLEGIAGALLNIANIFAIQFEVETALRLANESHSIYQQLNKQRGIEKTIYLKARLLNFLRNNKEAL